MKRYEQRKWQCQVTKTLSVVPESPLESSLDVELEKTILYSVCTNQLSLLKFGNIGYRILGGSLVAVKSRV
jgi:hypothetical protein